MKIRTNKGMRGVRARYDAALPPNISVVRHPGRPVISGMENHLGEVIFKVLAGAAQPRPRPFLSSSRGAPFSFLGYPRMPHPMPSLYSGTQRKHKEFASDVPSSAVLMRHQMQNLFEKLWLRLCLGCPCFL